MGKFSNNDANDIFDVYLLLLFLGLRLGCVQCFMKSFSNKVGDVFWLANKMEGQVPLVCLMYLAICL